MRIIATMLLLLSMMQVMAAQEYSVNLKPGRQLTLGTLVSGVVREVKVQPGQVVAQGDVRCQPWRAKRRLVDPSSREAALFSRRALRQRENKVGLRTRRPVIGRQVRSSNELARLLRSAW